MSKKLIYILCFLYSLNTQAFDNDYAIHRINFNSENFLDINSVQYDNHSNEQWHRSENGLRITAHSLSGDLLYSHTEIKLKSTLSDLINIRIEFKEAFFYVDKPHSSPLFEIEVSPFNNDLSISLINTVDYRKAESDIGLAITLGQRTGNYLRVKDLIVDPLFNDKNSDPYIDQASYTKNQHMLGMESAYHWNEKYSLRFFISDLSKMIFNFDDQITHFIHSGHQYNAHINYQKNEHETWLFEVKGFQTNKTLTTPTSHQIQQLNYNAINLQWLIRQNQPYQYSFGIRDDHFNNEINDDLNSSNNTRYRFKTTQIYSTVQHIYNVDKAWDIGIYIGLTREPYDVDQSNTAIFSHLYQSQLRLSWVIHSKNRRSRFKIHGSLNLDDIIDDPGDGLGITYQSTF